MNSKLNLVLALLLLTTSGCARLDDRESSRGDDIAATAAAATYHNDNHDGDDDDDDGDDGDDDRSEPGTETVGEIILEPAEPGPVFGYEDGVGPDLWAELSPEWFLCGEGAAQTPIDLNPGQADMATLDKLRLHYRPTPVDVVNNGHTAQFNYEPGSWLKIAGTRYELLQFHWHTPSEHTFVGEHQVLELHLVHRNRRGDLAVVGILVTAGDENAELASLGGDRTLAQILPRQEGVSYRFDELEIDASGLLPSDRTTFRYHGSLTTPPCSEGVRWFVYSEPLTLSTEQIDILRNALSQLKHAGNDGNNNRPLQPRNGRVVSLSR
ncbi:MAG: carbonic anhydrase family protein [Proteobacteria bacterium]|nr:carbonic anhydrase family protein [Pseudomonadota bacterium]